MDPAAIDRKENNTRKVTISAAIVLTNPSEATLGAFNLHLDKLAAEYEKYMIDEAPLLDRRNDFTINVQVSQLRSTEITERAL